MARLSMGRPAPLRAAVPPASLLALQAGHGRRRGPWRDAAHRFAANRIALLGGTIVLVFVLLAVAGPFLTPRDPNRQDWEHIAASPSSEYWLGTDELGRDLFSRILAGGRTALMVAVIATLVAAGLGTTVGAVSGYTRGWLAAALMRLTDMLMAFPVFLLAGFLSITLRPRIVNAAEGTAERSGLAFLGSRAFVDYFVVFGALAVVSWYGYARLMRGQVLSLREREFIEAARTIGASTRWIVSRHVLPNSVGPIIVEASASFGSAVLAESALSYLGIGVQPPTPSWGQMISANLDQWRYAPHLVLVPGGVLALLILGFNFFGDGIADALNPRRGRRS